MPREEEAHARESGELFPLFAYGVKSPRPTSAVSRPLVSASEGRIWGGSQMPEVEHHHHRRRLVSAECPLGVLS